MDRAGTILLGVMVIFVVAAALVFILNPVVWSALHH
jgi:hypothetical protein